MNEGKVANPKKDRKKTEQNAAAVMSNLPQSFARDQVLVLARRYEHVRHTLSAGEERRKEMESIVGQMRILAPGAEHLLPELTRVDAPEGERLAAVSILHEKPSLDYLQWLATRVAEDPGSFHGYHAAVALKNAAQVFRQDHRSKIQNAIMNARNLAKPGARGTDAFKVLDQAERELQ
jgi:hypothetical protein